MGSWFVRPETITLALSDGQSITIKKRLNAGDQRARFSRTYIAGADGTTRLNLLTANMATVTAFLVDWTVTDERGKVDIAGLSVDDLESVLDNIDAFRFVEIRRAIDAHETAQREESEDAKKKTRNGATASEAISGSPSDVAGVSTGSVN